MAILNILKKIKIPKFEDDFIQDHAEKAIEEAPVSCSGKVVYVPRQDPKSKANKGEAGTIQGDPWDERCRAIERHHDPSDPTSLMHLDVWE